MRKKTFLAVVIAFSINVYAQQTDSIKTVKIGSQIWMVENLKTNKLNNGEIIIEAKTNEEWLKAYNSMQPAWCYYNNDPANGAKYGKLYNYWAFNSVKGICPKGFHIPTDMEFQKLIDIAPVPKASFLGWVNYNGVINKSGFSALPGGWRDDGSNTKNGQFINIGKNDGSNLAKAVFWLINLRDPDRLNTNHVNPSMAEIFEYTMGAGEGTVGRYAGCSCRCLKD